jgi:hypothetical protein
MGLKGVYKVAYSLRLRLMTFFETKATTAPLTERYAQMCTDRGAKAWVCGKGWPNTSESHKHVGNEEATTQACTRCSVVSLQDV